MAQKWSWLNFHHVKLPPPPPGNSIWVGQLNISKKMENAENGLKMILAKFHHVEFYPTPPGNSTWASQLNMGKKI